MARRPHLESVARRVGPLGGLLALSAVLAMATHLPGHTQGDDFALYLRQARSLFEGDIGAVVADNRFAVLNSDTGFSPMAYPWGWPLLLSPFVHLFGLDYDRLKLVVVAAFCVWLAVFHGIVRRRIGAGPALAVTAVLATAPAYLEHTGQLLSEFPHLAVAAAVVWWYDRIRARGPLTEGATRDLVILGALASAAFNVRREGLVFVAVVAGIQVAELLVARRRAAASAVRRRSRNRPVAWRPAWRTVALPHAAFAAVTVGSQLLLPTTLLPDNGNSAGYIDDRFGDYPRVLSKHLQLGERPLVGVALLVVAVIGAAIGVRRRPATDGFLVLLTVLTALMIGTHFRLVERYWFQVTPWVVYFVGVALLEAARVAVRHRPRAALLAAVVPLLAVVVVHGVVVAGDIRDARRFADAGRVQIGPAHPDVAPIFDAVRANTPPSAVIAYFRARTMTLLTDRRSIQTKRIERIMQSADYFAERRNSDYSQPRLTTAQAEQLGLELVWWDTTWRLWRIPAP